MVQLVGDLKACTLRRKVGTDTKVLEDAVTMDIIVNNVSIDKIIT